MLFLKVFDATSMVQLEQLELLTLEKKMKEQEENVFIGKILDQKNQQIKAEWIKKNAKKKKRKDKSIGESDGERAQDAPSSPLQAE